VRVSSKGRRSWIVKYRVAGKEVEETLGTMLVIPLLSEARKRARASMDMAHGGVHPVRERRLKLVADQAAAAEQAFTLDKLIEDSSPGSIATAGRRRSTRSGACADGPSPTLAIIRYGRSRRSTSY
jgi:Arm DNA-binding domain